MADAPSPNQPVWHAPAGTVFGWHDGPVDRATGIRYARAERLAPPVPVSDAAEPIEATSWSPACPQAPVPLLDDAVGSSIGTLPVDEDCMRLSVTVPEGTAPDAGLPVMVWIHGGSYVSGAGDAPFCDPNTLVAEQNVAVVNVTYRLGLFGYLGDGETSPANLGLLDQIEALRWVKRNIAAFGGDAANVTVFGQSAGGDAAAHLMIAEGTRGLFRRAIVQSAPFGLMKSRSKMNAVMSRTASTVAPDAHWEEVTAAQSTVEKAASRFGLKGQMPFGVQYGHHPLPAEKDLDTAWREVAPNVDVLVGYTTREVALFAAAVPVLLKRLEKPTRDPALERLVVKPLTKKIYGTGARAFAARHAAAGGSVTGYVLSYGNEDHPLDAAHIAELPLLFPSSAWEGAPSALGLSLNDMRERGRVLRASWAEFARGGSVTSHPAIGLTVWDEPARPGPGHQAEEELSPPSARG